MLASITVPTLLIDQGKVLTNINKMADKARRHHLRLRPHFKTHQSQAIGRWFREAGIHQITVSSLRMAEYFAEDGWTDITVAFPVNVLEMDRINRLAGQIDLQLILENAQTAAILNEKISNRVRVMIEASTGYYRTGIEESRTDAIDAILDILNQSKNLEFTGFLGHAGHSYGARSIEAIEAVHRQSLALMAQLKAHYGSAYPQLQISLGDTPTCSTMEDFTGIDEIRPGNFVYYDLTQSFIGSCKLDEIAIALACPVVAKYPERGELVVYGGGVHLSKDRITTPEGDTIYGYLADWTSKGWKVIDQPDTYVKSLSQEHGVIKTTAERIDAVAIGDLIGIIPVHSCMTADLMKEVYTLEGAHLSMLQYV